ncbi:MAG: hypothetical protein EOP06_14115 [Proteobacteria bacterium]|nr:MAG: hypothetical protein EOP06_14115 [Pseudomonadota bacterium]
MRNQNGYGLIPMLIAVAVGAIVIGGLSVGIPTMIRSQKTVEFAQVAALKADEMETILSSKAACTAALGGQPVPAGATPTDVTADMRFADGQKILAKDNEFLQGLDVGALKISNIAGEAPLVVSSSTRKIVMLNLALRKQDSSLFANLTKARETRLHTILDGAGNIVQCQAETEEMKACTNSGGFYDLAAPNLGKTCIPYKHCAYGGSYADAPVAEGGFPNQLSTSGNRMNCPGNDADWTHQQTGVISTAVSCGKGCVGNKNVPVVTCMQCLSVPSSSAPATTEAPLPGDPGFNQDLDENEQIQDFINVQIKCETDMLDIEKCPWNPPFTP